MKAARHKRPHIAGFHLRELSREANPWGQKGDAWLPGAGQARGRGEAKGVHHGLGFQVGAGDEQVLEPHSGDGCSNVVNYFMPPRCAL